MRFFVRARPVPDSDDVFVVIEISEKEYTLFRPVGELLVFEGDQLIVGVRNIAPELVDETYLFSFWTMRHRLPSSRFVFRASRSEKPISCSHPVVSENSNELRRYHLRIV